MSEKEIQPDSASVPIVVEDKTPADVQLEIDEVAPTSAGTKWFAVIGVMIIVISLVMAFVLPALFIWWLVKKS